MTTTEKLSRARRTYHRHAGRISTTDKERLADALTRHPADDEEATLMLAALCNVLSKLIPPPTTLDDLRSEAMGTFYQP